MLRANDIGQATDDSAGKEAGPASSLTPEQRRQLIEDNLDQLDHAARKLAPRFTGYIDEDDLRQDGYLGLADAAEKFDPSCGVTFRTYASQRIRGAILDAVRERDPTPRLALRRCANLTRVSSQFKANHGRPPVLDDEDDLAELAALADIGSEEMARWVQEANENAAWNVKSFAAVLAVDDTGEEQRLLEIIPDRACSEDAEASDRREARQFLTGLTPRERMVVECRVFEDMTLKEIGQALGVTEGRVSQMFQQIKARLADNLAAECGELVKRPRPRQQRKWPLAAAR